MTNANLFKDSLLTADLLQKHLKQKNETAAAILQELGYRPSNKR